MSHGRPRVPPPGPDALRRTAEEVLGRRGGPADPGAADTERLRHELDVQTVELEMQNEQLQRTCAELRQAHDRYLRLYEFAPVGYLTLDAEGFIRTANLKFAAMLKSDRMRLAGLRLARLVHAEDRPRLYRLLKNITEPGSVAELRLAALDGTSLWVLLSAEPALDELGLLGECLLAVSDISAQKRIEAALSEREERLRLAAGAAQVGIFDWDIAAETVHSSGWHDAIFGYASPEGPGESVRPLRDWMARVHPEDLRRIRQLLTECTTRRKPFEAEYRVVRPDGQVRWVSGRGDVSGDGAGRPLRMVGTSVDVTARKRMEEDLSKSREELELRVEDRTRELARRVGQLRILAGELILTEQRERRRIAKLLHDHLQQLLVSAKFRVELLSRVDDEVIRRGAAEIEGILAECIDSSRSLTTELSPPILQEGGLAAGLHWLARWMANKHGLTVDLALDGDIPPMADDARALVFESVRELLFNAVKHARVHVAAVSVRPIHDGSLKVTVSDSGPGFDPAALAPPGGDGGGFGLFSIRERLDLIGGTLEIESAPGSGCRVVLGVPLAAEAPAPPSERLPAAAPDEPDAPALPNGVSSRIRILLADDHAVLREGLARYLGAETDIEIVGQAADGRTAIELARRLRPDVILMDLSMPGIGGVEATRTLLAEIPAVKIIGLSMFVEPERIREILAAGAAAYVSKSDAPSEILRAIRACAPKGPAP